MKKLIFIIFLLIGCNVMAQVVPATQVQISQFGRLKKLTVKPATPVTGFGIWYNLNDSLHFETPVKDWNLGKMAYTDTLNYYLLKSDTVYFLHQADLQGIRDSLGTVNSQWEVTDNELNALYPVNQGALKWLPDNRIIVGNIPMIRGAAGDTTSFAFSLDDRKIIQASMVSDGSGAGVSPEVRINGDIYADNINKVFVKSLTNGENNIIVGFKLYPTTKVFFNGQAVEPSRWAGVGTDTITLSLDTRQFDYLIIQN